MEQQLLDELHSLQERESEIHKQLATFRLQDKKIKNSKYVGKYYRDVHRDQPGYYVLYCVYGIDGDANLKTYQVIIYEDNPTHFNIEWYPHFDPEEKNAYAHCEIIEISVTEFNKHRDRAIQQVMQASNTAEHCGL